MRSFEWLDWMKEKQPEGERRVTKKGFGSPTSTIFSFFGNCVPYNKDDLWIKINLKMILCCSLLKSLCHYHMFRHHFLEDYFWGKIFASTFHQGRNWKRIFFIMIVENTKERFVSPTFDSCNIHIISFDLWILKGGVDTFVFLVHFLNDKWEP